MLRKCLCVRISPKCAFIGTIVAVLGSILFTVYFSLGWSDAVNKSRSDPDLILRYDNAERETWKAPVAPRYGLQWSEITTRMEDQTFYHGQDGKGLNSLSTGGIQQAQQVVSLLNMVKPVPRQEQVDQKELEYYVNVLVEGIFQDARRERPSLKPKPSCVGGIQEGEVEDLLCIPRPKFLPEVKNPCWFGDSGLKCLPYFHILGCAKSGTTDLWNRLMAHPHIISNDGLLHKEALWWSWRRFGMYGYKKGVPLTFEDYVNNFQDTARLIQSSLKKNNHFHQVLITGDGSPPDFWDFRGWHNISQNRGLESPRVLTPDLMTHFYPNPKFILMFKDPIDRLYSDYFFTGGGLTSEDFHRDVAKSIILMAKCVKKRDLKWCFSDNTLHLQMPVRLSYVCYSFFMREWLQVFSLDRFLFIKTEEYEVNPEGTLKKVIEFLDLRPLKKAKLHEIADEEKSRITMQKQVAGPMKPQTKAILSKLLKPCNQHLVELIKLSKFVWNS